MRSRLISVLQQSVQRSQKFADYNFRNYFVAKYATKLEQVAPDKFGPITEEVLNKAEADLEMLIRQTTIQEIDHFRFRAQGLVCLRVVYDSYNCFYYFSHLFNMYF